MNDSSVKPLSKELQKNKQDTEDDTIHLTKELDSLRLDAPKELAIDTKLLEKLEKSELLHKKMAIQYKKNQQMQKAREMLVESKRIREQIDRVSTGLPLSPLFELHMDPIYEEMKPPTTNPSPSVATLESNNVKDLPLKPKTSLSTVPSNQTSKSLVSSDATNINTPINPMDPSNIIINDREKLELSLADIQETFDSKDPKDIFTHLIESLQSQIESCVKIASSYFKAGQKDKALEFHKLKKAYLMDLETLKALSVTPGSHPPIFKHIPISYDYEVSFPELSLTELELVIVSVDKVDMIPSSDGMMASVSFDMDGVSDVPNSPHGHGETSAHPIKSCIGK